MAFQRRPISVATRVTFSLVLLSVTTALIANQVADHPSRQNLDLQRKRSLCEALAVSCSLHADRHDITAIEQNIQAVVKRTEDIASARLVTADGNVLAELGDHARNWKLSGSDASTEHNIQVPILNNGVRWGTLEISFTAPPYPAFVRFLIYPTTLLSLTTLVVNAGLFRWYLGRILTYLNPSTAVPQHVRSTIDTFAEGVAVLDESKRIVLANRAFASYLELTEDTAVGRSIESFPWQTESAGATLPWNFNSADEMRTGQPLRLVAPNNSHRTFLVSASPVLDERHKRRGTVVSFDDITSMVQKREELRYMLIELQRSRDELTLRNKELQVLATRDPLTACLNRRTFFETFEREWNLAQRGGFELSCAMVDIDHFKSINDRFGHSRGDEVLQQVARTITESCPSHYIVCRYGGEEFCILMLQTTIDEAEVAANKVRLATSDLNFGELRVTASVGVSSLSLKPLSPQEMLDQADRCLYVAKRNGRNQTIRWDDVPEDVSQEDHGSSREQPEATIPYPAVASLVSALAYRHPDTAAHSTRVAEYAVATARGLMTAQDAYVLEIGALLHDIGKIGVPDAILLKPGPLTPEEWKVMQVHDRIGVEIIESAFSNRQLHDILRYHHTFFRRSSEPIGTPQGENIPLGARIVAIADAYDAIVSDRVYRKGRSQEEAFAELKRFAGTQFDPALVARFINTIKSRRSLDLPMTSKLMAMQIGIQIEHLTEAVDSNDRRSVTSLASRLRATAAHHRLPAIEEVAALLEETSANREDDLVGLVNLTNQLVELCQQLHQGQRTSATAHLDSAPTLVLNERPSTDLSVHSR